MNCSDYDSDCDSEEMPPINSKELASRVSQLHPNQSIDQIAPSLRWFHIDDQFYLKTDKYLGKGTYGEVYRGFTHDGDECAIKLGRISPNEVEYARQASRNSPSRKSNVSQVLSSNIDDGILITELAHSDLKTALSQLNPKEKLIIIRGILNGLIELNAEGIIHCDLKLRNILVMQREGYFSSKISDFGFAIKSRSEFRGGTRWYYSPEIWRKHCTCKELSDQHLSKLDVWSTMLTFIELAPELLSQQFLDRFDKYDAALTKAINENKDINDLGAEMCDYFYDFKSQSPGLFSDLTPVTPLDRLVQSMAIINPKKRISAAEALRLFDGLFTKPPMAADSDLDENCTLTDSEDFASSSDDTEIDA